MSQTVFFRLLDDSDKEAVLARSVGGARRGTRTPQEFTVDPVAFEQIPGSPFAYWADAELLALFARLPPLESDRFTARFGLSTKNDFRFVRAWWECSGSSLNAAWYPLVKGGSFAPYYSDPHLVIDWENDGARLKQFATERTSEIFGKGSWSRWINSTEYYFRPGVTWSRRSQRGLSMRVMPAGCIFADKGPAVFGPAALMSRLLGLANSGSFHTLVGLQMAFGSYEVGVVQRTPVPSLDCEAGEQVGLLALSSVEIKRRLDTANEISHVFALPAILQAEGRTLYDRIASWECCLNGAETQLAINQREIDRLSQRLYGIEGLGATTSDVAAREGVGAADDDSDSAVPDSNPTSAGADLVSYALGCAIGRWDIRIATGARSAPALPNPFDSLPVYSPAMLRAGDGDHLLDYPIDPAAHGMIPTDPDHPHGVVRSVRQVLALLLPNTDATENEICNALGVQALLDYFDNPRHFFEHHLRRYSRSRRKAPIYWLLQSPNRCYGLWLYYHKFDGDTLYKALKLYVEPRIRLEEDRLEAARAEQAGAASGSRESKAAAKEVERHEDVLSDIYEFRDRLQRAADLNLRPDLDDGVILNMAPLHELVPWKEPKKYWDELTAGKYEWSSIGKQLRARGLVDTAKGSE